MYFLEKNKNKIAQKINFFLEEDLIEAKDFVVPPNIKMGDISLPCFVLAKTLKKSPVQIASDLCSDFSADKEFLKNISVQADGPYLNFKFNFTYCARELGREIKNNKEKYGCVQVKNPKRIMLEFSNANTHKEYHIGHLRNLSYGSALTALLATQGDTIIPVSYINDFGIHVAKTLWAYMKFYKDKDLPENKGYFLGQTYVLACREEEKDKSAKQMIELVMKKIESRQGEEYELWKKSRKWSIEQFEKIYKELNTNFVHTFYESEFIDKGRKMLVDLEKQGILKKSKGALIADLEKYDLGVLVVLRSDGTATYPVADIPLALEKIKKFNLDESVYIVDFRQKLYFKQLFKILELMGRKEKFIHLDYDFVKLPDGAMSSRKGKVITYEDLKNDLLAIAIKETKKRHPDWTDEKIKKNAQKIVVAIMKFEMIKVSPKQEITFDKEKVFDFSGYTAPYLLYSLARINSIFKKDKNKENKNPDLSLLKEEGERNLFIKMAYYPEVLKKSAKDYDPSELTRYVFELAQMFNDYYHSTQILSSDKKTKQARLFLLNSLKEVMENSLQILGIPLLKEM